ncbi:hypothetical protein JXA80_04370, partial [bacterium]|nr:hypothetical protein [candidate division CSSED10-310 bacterium]
NVFAVTDSMGALFLNAQLNDGATARIDPRTCTAFGVDLMAPETHVLPGDTFFLDAEVCNPDEPVTLPLFVLLDVGTGEYWFYPSWISSRDGIDYENVTVISGSSTRAILPAFTWPDTGDLSLEVHFFGAFTDPEITQIIGTVDQVAVFIGM